MRFLLLCFTGSVSLAWQESERPWAPQELLSPHLCIGLNLQLGAPFQANACWAEQSQDVKNKQAKHDMPGNTREKAESSREEPRGLTQHKQSGGTSQPAGWQRASMGNPTWGAMCGEMGAGASHGSFCDKNSCQTQHFQTYVFQFLPTKLLDENHENVKMQ